MSEDEIKGIIHSVLEAVNKRDFEKAAYFDADDKIMITPEGTFKGKEEIRRYYKWSSRQFKELKFTEKELIVQGNKAAMEFVVECTTPDGKRGQVSGLGMFEFRDGKMQRSHMSYDRISVAKQLAKGGLKTGIVNSMIGQMEKGLHLGFNVMR
ncbi:MAG: nuclear transport factor 2 family protein [Candidatus Bathyarchaeota archaeon]